MKRAQRAIEGGRLALLASFRPSRSVARSPALFMLICTSLLFQTLAFPNDQIFKSKKTDFRATIVVSGLEHPWSMAFLPGDQMLITERSGNLLWYKNDTIQSVKGLPKILAGGQGGLLDLVLHPNYPINRRICFCYSAGERGSASTEIACGRFDNGALLNLQVIFRAKPKTSTSRHFGSRLLFGPDGNLYATLGDRGHRPNAQDLQNHHGSVIRITDTGQVPADNPFLGRDGAKPEIFAYGNRNPQGITLDPNRSKIWMHEHGPRGGDELNILSNGANYGWPLVSFGQEYFFPKPVGESTHKAGMKQPLYHWAPSIAPSGMTFYSGKQIPEWRNNLFIGSLKFKLLVRLELAGEAVTGEEHLMEGAFGRVRDVRESPDGFLYLLTDRKDGQLIRLEPAGSYADD